MKMITQDKIKMKFVDFEAEDVNDPDWDKIINILRKNDIRILYGDGNWMNLAWREEWEN